MVNTDSELKQYLEAMQGDLTSLKQDLSSVKQDVATMKDRIMARVDGRIDDVESRMRDFVGSAILDLETKIVGDFWKWGRTSDMRTRQSLGESAALNERMLNVEDRVSALERRPS